jgi:hypothetical protein
MKTTTYTLKITKEEKEYIKAILSEWRIFIKDALRDEYEKERREELFEELKQMNEILWKIRKAKRR